MGRSWSDRIGWTTPGAVATETRAVIAALDRPAPAEASESRQQLATLGRMASSLGSRLDILREPLAPERLARLTSKETPVSAESYNAIDALLQTPFLEASQRVALWASLWSIDQRLSEETLRLDAEDGRILRASDSPELFRHPSVRTRNTSLARTSVPPGSRAPGARRLRSSSG